MKKIKKLWGIGLVVVLLASLMLVAVPVSPAAAGNLTFTNESLPGPFGNQIVTGAEIVDMSISGDGTIYAATGSFVPVGGSAPVLYKSTNQGATWTAINAASGPALLDTDYVAVAPDDSDLVIISDGTDIWVSQNGGASWSDTSYVGTVSDLAIAPMQGPFHYLTAAGGNDLQYFNLGATIPGWTSTVSGPGWDSTDKDGSTILTVAYSPMFTSDYTALVVTQDGVSTFFEQVFFNTRHWNTFGPTYPVVLEAAAVATHADIALAPDYLGADEAMRTAFVGLTIGGSGGIYRVLDDFSSKMNAASYDIWSVAYDGTTLVAGATSTNNVYRSLDPMAPIPSVLGARTLKKPGLEDGSDNVIVGIIDGDVVAAKAGIEGGFSVSMDNGLTFNDISLLNTAIANLQDFADGMDTAVRYVVTDDGTYTSVWRQMNMAWVRVLVLDYASTFRVAVDPDDAMNVYVVHVFADNVYYSTEGGDTRWFQRATPYDISDIAVESGNVVYISVYGAPTVTKSTNSGFTWSFPTQPAGWVGDSFSLTSLGTGNLILTSDSGEVAYSTDGAATWTDTSALPGDSYTYAAASGLAAGDAIFAVDEDADIVYRWVIGTNLFSWDVIGTTGADWNAAVEYVDGVLYVFGYYWDGSTNVVILARTLNPMAPAIPLLVEWSIVEGEDIDLSSFFYMDLVKVAPGNSFSFTADVYNTSIGMWLPNIVNYTDTLATAAAAPVLSAPANDYLIPVSLFGTANSVTLSWAPVTGATSYDIQVASDAGFVHKVSSITGNVNPPFQVVTNADITPGTQYYWRVRVADPLYSQWSEAWTFRVQPSQAMVPNLDSPANGGTVSSESPGFSWTPITGTTSYKFEISTNAAFATTVYTDEVYTAGAQLPVTITLEPGTQYFWRVKALTPVEGDWSTVGNFMVAEPAPTTTATEPTPTITFTTQPPPTITITQPGETTITVPPPTTEEVAPAYIWAIIVIGAILVIAVIVLIVRTRRSV